MMENPSALLKAAQEFASQLITTKVSKEVTFHTLQHTREVVAACAYISPPGCMIPDTVPEKPKVMNR
jgi:hypothetical protein